MANENGNDPGDFLACLMQDHARIEVRLKALETAAGELSRVETDAAALGVVTGTLSFFATEGAHHEAHEELTLFPRLRPIPEFKQILSALELQHRMNDAAGQELAACIDGFAPGRGRELRHLTYRFAEMHRGHAIAEERALFPRVASVLSPVVVAEMTREMRERNSKVRATKVADR